MNANTASVFAFLLAIAVQPLFADVYAYKVQYLESTGVQYIDTGIQPQADTMFRAKYEYIAYAKGNDMIGGCNNPRYYPVSMEGNDVRKERHCPSADFYDYQQYRTCHTIVFNDAQHRVFKDGRYLNTASVGAKKRNCFLFAASNDGKSGAADWFSKARIYWCDLVSTSTGTVLRRFIPVVDENGRPAMFDEVNSTLYYNKGSGADFTAGPRKEEPWYFVEYLQSTGTQWIDTGVLAKGDMRANVGYRFTDLQQNGSAMIGGVQSPSRYYPISIQGNGGGLKERYVYSGNELKVTYSALADREVWFNADSSHETFVDGASVGTFTSAFDNSTESQYLFAARNVSGKKADWLSKSRIYHYDLYEAYGTMCAAFRPAVDSTGAGCMYDIYRGSLHRNSGGGTFKMGRIISPKVALDLSERTDLAVGLKVMSFEVRPSWGTVFELDVTTAATYDAEVRSDGVYLAAKGATEANVMTVTGDTAANFAVGSMPTCSSVVLSGMVRLTADCDWRGLGKIVIPDGVTINLNGHNLQTSGFTVLPETVAMITDTSANGSGGSLRVEVAANELFVNDRVPLMGSLKLVKEGAGTYLAALLNQAYTGGTEVLGGMLRSRYGIGPQARNLGATTYLSPIPQNSEVKVGAGGTLDVNGNYWNYLTYTLDGGTLMSSRVTRSDSGSVASPFTLTDDSVVSNKSFGLVCSGWNELKVRLNGHTLRYDGIPGSGNAFFFGHATFEGEGKLEIGSSWICATNCTYSSIGRNLTLEQHDSGHGGLWLAAPLTVSNCVMRGSGGAYKGNAQLTVLGRFAPLENSTNYFHNTALADGATLDLSGCGGIAFNVVSKNNHRVTFPANGTVTLDVSTRSDLADGLLIVAWDAIPSTTTFALDAASAATWRAIAGAEGVTLVTKGTGDIEFAEWTGAAGNGNPSEPNNWICYDFNGQVVENALPMATTTIRVTGTTSMPYPTGVPWGRLQLVGNVTLVADCDWREFGTIDISAGVTVNLNGHQLKVVSFTGAGTVNGISGELRVEVAEGKTLTNSSLALGGGITLVKAGAGTYVASKQQQTYTGGTTIAAGLLKASVSGATLPLGAENSVFAVNQGATFDFNHQYNYNRYKCVLAGGTLVNSGSNMGAASGERYNDSLGDIALTADSFVSVAHSILLSKGALNLGGHTLLTTITTSGVQLYMNGMTVSNGTLCVARASGIDDAWLHVHGGTDFKDTTLDIDAAAALYQLLPVKTLINRYAGSYASGPGSFHVSGRFKPVSGAFHNVTLLDGAELDLTENTGVFSSRSTINHVGAHYLGVARGANIAIDVTGRTDLHNGDKVMEWEPEPELVHRWMFNGSYEDSVGTATATATSAAVTLGENTVSTPGLSKAQGYVNLGSNLIPTNQGPVTVEFWARLDKLEAFGGKFFCCGADGSSNLIAFMHQDTAATQCVGYMAYGGKTSSDTAWNTIGVPSIGTMEHFALVVSDITPPTGWHGMVWNRHALDGTYIGGSTPNVSTAWALDKLGQAHTTLGGAWWNSTDTPATFDEVRIWKGALTVADLEANAAAPCDTILKSYRDTAKFRAVDGAGRWNLEARVDGLYLDKSGLLMILR